jgi:hypothetical protein
VDHHAEGCGDDQVVYDGHRHAQHRRHYDER